jgi:hypothetical protein
MMHVFSTACANMPSRQKGFFEFFMRFPFNFSSQRRQKLHNFWWECDINFVFIPQIIFSLIVDSLLVFKRFVDGTNAL